MTSVIMTAAAIAMAASKKIGQSDLGGWRRGGSFVGIWHHSRVRSLAEVNEVCREARRGYRATRHETGGHLNEIPGTTRITPDSRKEGKECPGRVPSVSARAATAGSMCRFARRPRGDSGRPAGASWRLGLGVWRARD
jgi:hypothetical protein